MDGGDEHEKDREEFLDEHANAAIGRCEAGGANGGWVWG